MAMFRKAAWWLPVGFAFNDVFAGFHFVSGDSMSPTLNPPESVGEDVILIDRLSFRQVLFTSPHSKSKPRIRIHNILFIFWSAQIIQISTRRSCCAKVREAPPSQLQCHLGATAPNNSAIPAISFSPISHTQITN